MARSDFRFSEPLRVRWAEVDAQGIVFNGHYLAYFDVGVTEYYRAIDKPYPEAILAEASGAISPFERTELHWLFHRTLYSKANRRRLLWHIECLYDSIGRYFYPIWAAVGVSHSWTDSHLALLSAVRRGKLDRAESQLIRDMKRAASRVRRELRRMKKREDHSQ